MFATCQDPVQVETTRAARELTYVRRTVVSFAGELIYSWEWALGLGIPGAEVTACGIRLLVLFACACLELLTVAVACCRVDAG